MTAWELPAPKSGCDIFDFDLKKSDEFQQESSRNVEHSRLGGEPPMREAEQDDGEVGDGAGRAAFRRRIPGVERQLLLGQGGASEGRDGGEDGQGARQGRCDPAEDDGEVGSRAG